ncbi:MAG: hypothetical protein K2I10_00995 [Lachnospiraceae bacterium]|nr:hypothetical protein [Lachnospiraceae bacterium]
MNKRYIAIVLLIIIVLLGGCGKIEYPDLANDAFAITMGTYEDFGSIEYNDRIYIPYGTINDYPSKEEIKECIGYIIADENSSSVVDKNDRDRRIYTLVDDDENNYLMDYYVGQSIMEQPIFWRAIDTKGKDVNTPKYIESQEYSYWNE